MKTSSKKILHIDIETYCELDLLETGVYAYASHPSFEILLFSYGYDDGPVTCIDMTCEEIPYEVICDIESPEVLKVAHNANFEMTCLAEGLGLVIEPNEWVCTMAMALHLGLPGSLAQLGEVLKIEEQKMAAGKLLINYFSKPCKPSRANGERTRNLPKHDMAKWNTFKDYNIRDVEVEQHVFEALKWFSQPSFERDVFILDQEINSRGILIDREFVDNAVAIESAITEGYRDELKEITGLDNPNSTPQFKKYLEEKGISVDSFTKKTGASLLSEVNDPEIKRAIQLKLFLGKTSCAKYEAMINGDGGDHRIRGLFQYYGANRTGRWAGRRVQLQNLPQNHLEYLDETRNMVKNYDMDALEMFYENIPDVLSQLIRTSFVAREGYKLIVADYSAIEARVIAWLANEKWRIDVFRDNGDIYCASASQMFNVPVVKHGINGHLRQKGKIAELALGYGGGPSALKSMGALEMGLTEDELPKLVKMWRNSNRMITGLWSDVGDAALDAIENPTRGTRYKNLAFAMFKGSLFIKLPSGRKLCYQQAKIVGSSKGNKIQYAGVNQTSRKWESTDTWGGKLVENIIQAIARDCLAFAMLRLRKHGYEIVGHVHDEVIIEAPMDATVEEVCRIMCEPVSWAEGLLLNAEGYETPYYKKD